jgi:hypothetical protein
MNEVQMRYLSNPGNIEAIGAIIRRAFEELADLPPDVMYACPPWFVHCSDCKCCSVFGNVAESRAELMIDERDKRIRQLTALVTRLQGGHEE